MAVATIRDRTGSYAGGFLLLVALAAAGRSRSRCCRGGRSRPTWPPSRRRYALIPFGASGRLRSRVPVAAKIAFATAGARPMIGVSPAPAEGRSLRSSSTVSSTGTSLKRGTR